MVDYWAGQEDLIDDMQNGGSCAPVTDYSGYANRMITWDPLQPIHMAPVLHVVLLLRVVQMKAQVTSIQMQMWIMVLATIVTK